MIGATLLLGFLSASPATAAELPRKILALYDKHAVAGAQKDPFFTLTHQRAEMPLNYLGMELVYHDVALPLPSTAALAGYRGVLSWFTQPAAGIADPDSYCRWLTSSMNAGLKVVILEHPGVPLGPNGALSTTCDTTLRRLGADWQGLLLNPEPARLKMTPAAPNVAEFERLLRAEEVSALPIVRPLTGSFARLKVEVEEGVTSVPIMTSAAGGMALGSFVRYENTEVSPPQFRWRLDPFLFFEAAFGLKGRPRPDTTTINGRRLYFSHVDGDGFFNISEVDKRSYSGEIFLKEVLERYDDLPITVSVITGYYDQTRFNKPESFALTRRIFSLPYVEPASHGYAHPLLWHLHTLALRIPGYRYSAYKEIIEALNFINETFLPIGKKSSLLLWTGNCLPNEAEIRLSRTQGHLNMNGGSSRFNKYFPSHGYVSPLGRGPLGARQVYSASANENEYTDLWKGPFYGFRDVLDTYARTEEPRRLKPVDVYVHFYSAEKIAALKILRQIYDWAKEQPFLPVTASEYARIVDGFFDMRLLEEAPGRWRAEGGAALRTLRFDGETRAPDLALSRGVIGFSHRGSSLYVHLDENSARLVVLAQSPSPLPHVEHANFAITSWRREGAGARFFKRGWRKESLSLAGLVPGRRYRVFCGDFKLEQRAGGDGRLTAQFPEPEGPGPAREVTVTPL